MYVAKTVEATVSLKDPVPHLQDAENLVLPMES